MWERIYNDFFDTDKKVYLIDAYTKNNSNPVIVATVNPITKQVIFKHESAKTDESIIDCIDEILIMN